MSLSEFLQCNEVMRCTKDGDPKKLLSTILTKGNEWFQLHPEESLFIRSNLDAFGFKSDKESIAVFQRHLILHYYEKLLGLCLPPAQFREFLLSNITVSNGIEQLNSSLSQGKAVLLANGHFGAVEFSTPLLAAYKLPVNTVLRFKTETLAQMASERAAQLTSEAEFGKINFIQIGRAGTAAAMEMAAALRRKEVLLSIFDEKTEYSKKVPLFGLMVWGGAGIDRIIRYSGTDLDVFTIFTIRTTENRYRLHIEKIDTTDPSMIISNLYTSLENIVANNPEQWYFLHEEVPFVEESLLPT
jgi:lauroyl/myristoyl acyltransferase